MIDKNRDMFMGYSYPYMDNNIENRINILERNIRRLEERVTRLEGGTYSTESYTSTFNTPYPNNMYNML